ncbi:MAG: hypothetical protein IT460_02465 [Planctomycetes bacterium]|nr:hypothetical protein [Planctomycetota bacterium]
MPRTDVSPARCARVLLAVLLPMCSIRAATAADAPPPPAPAPSPAAGLEDTLTLGARFFDQAIAWVARGGSLGRAVDVYAHLDAKWDLEDNHHEGEQAVWFLAPDKMRNEMAFMGRVSTKILSGDRAWVVTSNGAVKRVHGTPGAEVELKQMKEDMLRIQDLTAFMTLEGLKGPGIQFEYQGASRGSGVYAGDWLKVARRSPDGRKITFWLAYEAAPGGGVSATWPGVVRIDGDAATGLWTEDWILQEWDAPRAKPRPFRYPSRLQAWRSHPDPKMAKDNPPKRFLTAVVDDLDINAGIGPDRFEPPPETPR